MNDKKLAIGMERGLCPICGAKHDTGALFIGKTFVSEQQAKELEDRMREPTTYHICGSCQEHLDQGLYALIGIDEDLTIDDNPFRTGIIMWLTQQRIEALFDEITQETIHNYRCMYADKE